MPKYLVSINDLPPDGKEFELDDQEVWLEPLREFKMDCRIDTPLKMKVSVLPADAGCLVRGNLAGNVTVPCSRCAENAQIKVESNFDEYEEIPPDTGKNDDSDETHIIYERGVPMLNLGEIAWEQFMLALPARPLCRHECKGLCPQCGTNLNIGPCGCEITSEDNRMAALKNYVVKK